MKGMATIRLAQKKDKALWNTKSDHPLQSWEWGEFRKSQGIDVVRLMYERKNATTVSQITFHRIPYTPYTIGYLPKGPILDKIMIDELKSIGKTHHAIFIQIEPNDTDGKKLIHNQELLPSHHPLFTKYTFVLDLTKSEEELLGAMHNKTRYNIRVAQKHGVTTQEDNSDTAFASYLNLSEETTRRQGFYAHDKNYHIAMWHHMRKDGVAHLFTATYNKEILAAWIIFAWKKTIYYPYGASSRSHRETMAPNLLLWNIARWAKAKGYTSFDLWGALGPTPDQRDPWYGFHRFKEGYHPTLVTTIGSYDLVIHVCVYQLYKFIDIIRWKLLSLCK